MKDRVIHKFTFIFTSCLFLMLIASVVVAAPPFETATYNNNRPYNWHHPQAHTGEKSSSNCGPTSIHMSMMYQNPDNAPSAEEIRKWRPGTAHTGPSQNKDWYWNVDIGDALEHFGYKWEYYQVRNKDEKTVKEAMKKYLRDGHVLIVCINMTKVTSTEGSIFDFGIPKKDKKDAKSTRFDCYYKFVSGHFIVLKGYLDKGDWFVVYDPYNFDNVHYYDGGRYPDGDPMGKERYYNMNEIVTSVIEWNKDDPNYVFTAIAGSGLTSNCVVSTKTLNTDQMIRLSTSQTAGTISFKLMGKGPYIYRIFDVKGNTLYKKSGMINGAETTTLNNFTAGMYILHYNVDGKTYRQKFNSR